ncbi:MAG: ACP S-malonyltransferase [Oceanococcus sp.]|nr:MAG: ACP S-malonyltransferase [Oceanococcus sp.]
MTSSHSTSIVFPGQGVQRPGMGQEFHDNFALAKDVYEEASEACGIDIAGLCFSADDERLNLTEFAQPAILCTEIAMWRVLQQELDLQTEYCLFAGHSLGEYTALVAAGALPLSAAAVLVRERGRLMQQAAPVGSGAMLAVISDQLDLDLIRRVIKSLDVDIANDNSSSQIVLSGSPSALQQTQQLLSQQLVDANMAAWRFVPLAVSAPFHSRFMAGIESAFESHLMHLCDELQVDCAPQVASNYSGGFHNDDFADICHKLVKQISGTVRWRDNMQTLFDAGAPVIEIGPGKPLRGFFKTLGIDIHSVVNLRSLNRLSNRLASAA